MHHWFEGHRKEPKSRADGPWKRVSCHAPYHAFYDGARYMAHTAQTTLYTHYAYMRKRWGMFE